MARASQVLTQYRVRRADANDADDLKALQRLHLATFPDYDMPGFSYGDWWLAEALAAGGKWKPVAFAGLQPSRTTVNGGYFARAGVTKAHRGRGLQRRLIRVRVLRAKARGYGVLVTDTTDVPHSARNLARSGFRPFTPAKPWLPYKTTVYWKKEL